MSWEIDILSRNEFISCWEIVQSFEAVLNIKNDLKKTILLIDLTFYIHISSAVLLSYNIFPFPSMIPVNFAFLYFPARRDMYSLSLY